jgi:hypothetical protein
LKPDGLKYKKKLWKFLKMRKEGEKEKVEDPLLKSVKTSNVQWILSAMESLTDELCAIDRVWERSAKVQSSVIVSVGPYCEIAKEGRKEGRKERKKERKKERER